MTNNGMDYYVPFAAILAGQPARLVRALSAGTGVSGGFR